MHVLLIDDDQRLGELLARYFEKFDIELDHALTPSKGFARLHEVAFDLVILDVMLPEMDGFEVCKRIRKTSDIPIVMLTARGEVMDRVVGIEIGADDYLPKPFEPRELVVRIQSIIKRVKRTPVRGHELLFQHMRIDTDAREVYLDEQPLTLTMMEYSLLLMLAKTPNKAYSRDEILNELKGIDTELFSRSVDILVSRLRKKLMPHDFIKTLRGAGYCFAGKSL